MRGIEQKRRSDHLLSNRRSMFMAEPVGFEPTCLLGKRFSRPPRYDRFDTAPLLRLLILLTLHGDVNQSKGTFISEGPLA